VQIRPRGLIVKKKFFFTWFSSEIVYLSSAHLRRVLPPHTSVPYRAMCTITPRGILNLILYRYGSNILFYHCLVHYVAGTDTLVARIQVVVRPGQAANCAGDIHAKHACHSARHLRVIRVRPRTAHLRDRPTGLSLLHSGSPGSQREHMFPTFPLLFSTCSL
jgi:hypothetical protein